MRASARFLLACLVTTLSPPAMADSQPAAVCRDGSDYLVIVRKRDGEPGSDILVRRKPAKPAPCRFASTASDYLVGQGEAADVLAMSGRFLVLDAGTGPDRRLLIFDVAARRKLVDTPYDDARKLATAAEGFIFWKVGPKPVKPSACPASWRKAPDNAGAKSAHPSAETLFAFADGTTRSTGKADCLRLQTDM